jgi:hypothetical protein
LNFFDGLRAKDIGAVIMLENEKQVDNDMNFQVSPKLSADLKAVFKPARAVPSEVDRAVLDQAHRQLTRRHRPRRIFRWAASVGAAAAVIVFAFVLHFAIEPISDVTKGPLSQVPTKPSAIHTDSLLAEVQLDLDRNGRVDILDAFKLARQIESSGGRRRSKAVATERAGTDWDMNGDGFVNHDDVDFVAFAAVRLNKGVL